MIRPFEPEVLVVPRGVDVTHFVFDEVIQFEQYTTGGVDEMPPFSPGTEEETFMSFDPYPVATVLKDIVDGPSGRDV